MRAVHCSAVPRETSARRAGCLSTRLCEQSRDLVNSRRARCCQRKSGNTLESFWFRRVLKAVRGSVDLEAPALLQRSDVDDVVADTVQEFGHRALGDIRVTG